MLRRLCDAEELGLAKMRGEDLEADGEIFPAVEIGGAAGDGNARDAGEIRGEGEDVGELFLKRIARNAADLAGGAGGNG